MSERTDLKLPHEAMLATIVSVAGGLASARQGLQFLTDSLREACLDLHFP